MPVLQAHCSVLAGAGINELGSLGSMSINGNVVVPVGLVRPTVSEAQRRKVTLFQEAHQFRTGARGSRFVRISGTATLLTAQPLTLKVRGNPSRSAMLPPDLFLNVSYLVAQTLTLANGTNLILLDPLQHLIVLAEHLVVGSNVTVSYERAPHITAAVPPKPGKPGTPTQASPFSDGYRGSDGTAGVKGGIGQSFHSAPEIEIWTLDLTGTPAVDLRGQDGSQGGPGGPGGDGGNGGQGSNGKDAWVGCKYGPGNGGDGGIGGRAGDGGPGGNGAPGGRFQLFAPAGQLANLMSSGFFVSVDGGQAGAGGMPGVPGSGGSGGPPGGFPPSCSGVAASRRAGNAGGQGAVGQQGLAGQPGPVSGTDPIKLVPIQPYDFTTALLKPAIISLSTSYAHEGDQVSVNGKDLATTDVVRFQVDATSNVSCATTVFSNTAATFVVPAVAGGPRTLFIEQSDGTRTNLTTLYILPTINGIENGPRVRPGAVVKVFGTGLASGARILVNGLDVGPTTFIDPHTVSAVVIRPTAGIQPNPDGEVVDFQVALQDLTQSNTIQIVLDTYKIVVVGDSIAWGCGLTESEKFSTLVAQRVQQDNGGGIGVYSDVAAHTGAIIGRTVTQPAPELPGEVPTSGPTVFQQVQKLAARPSAPFVDLVLVDGGINDIGLNQIFDWMSTVDIASACVQYCLDDMKQLLSAVGAGFPTARVVVTGYYAPLSNESADNLAERFIVGFLAMFGFDAILAVKKSDLAKVYARCALFKSEANTRLAQAVSQTNAALGGAPRFFFADPSFHSTNAVFASVPWVFGIGSDLSPEDGMRRERAVICASESGDDGEVFCVRASMGHPNPMGAQAYAQAIYPYLS